MSVTMQWGQVESYVDRVASATQANRRAAVLWLVLIVTGAFALRLIPTLIAPSVHHPDEIMQYLEPAHRLAFGQGLVTWEYRVGLRSWLLPGAIAGLMWMTSLVADTSTAYLAVVHAALTILSLGVVVAAYEWGYRIGGLRAAIIVGIFAAAWFELIYFAPRSLTEVVAAHLLVIALYIAYPHGPTAHRGRLLAAGLLLGLVVALRLHYTPAVAVAMLGICRTQIKQCWLPMTLGALMTLVLSGLLDAVTWGYPFQSYITNVRINVLQDKASQYGVYSFDWYIREFTWQWAGAVVAMGVLCVVALRRFWLLAAVALAVVVPHMFIAHKEYRFIFAALPLVVILAGIGAAEVSAWIEAGMPSRRRWLVPMVCVGILMLTSAVLAVRPTFRDSWYRGSGYLEASMIAGQDEELRALALVKPGWWYTGGYTYLHRDVPILFFESTDKALHHHQTYDYLIAAGKKPLETVSLKLVQTWPKPQRKGHHIYLYRRLGSESTQPDLQLEVSHYLERKEHESLRNALKAQKSE